MAQDYDAGGMLRRPSGVRTDVGTLLGRTMRLVALTVGVALDAYLARNLSGGWAMAFWIASFSNVDPEAVWEAGGYAKRQDLSAPRSSAVVGADR